MVEIRLFGPLRVSADGGAPGEIGSGRERTLLALLAINPGRTATSDELIEAVWGDELPADPKHALQSAMSRLRRTLGSLTSSDVVLTDSSGYRLVDETTTDVQRFGDLVDRAGSLNHDDPVTARDLLAEAVDLGADRALADFAYDNWAQPHITLLSEALLLATANRIELDLRLGRHNEVVPELQRLIIEHPLRERFWGQLMLALYRSGRQDAALAAFGEARRLLGEELGVEPSGELRRLEQAILDQDPELDAEIDASLGGSAPAPPRHLTSAEKLPIQLTSFVGRGNDLEALEDLAGEQRLVTLTGAGGTGKTRLAIELASALGDAHPDGVWFVDLAKISSDDEVWSAIGTARGVREHESGDLASAIATHIGPDRALMLIDNCEHVIAGAAAAAERLMVECPGLRILATSREPLKAAGEVVWPVAPLRIPQQASDLGVEDVSGFDAITLLADRLTALNPRFVLDDDSARALARISAAVDGIPLALELAAARAAVMGPIEVSELLADHYELLEGGRRSAAPRQQSYEATVRWSYDLLQADEQRVFRALAVFRGGFDLAGAEQISGASPDDVPTFIARLGAASLISRDAGAVAGGRYRMLEPVRQAAAKLLGEHDEETAAREAHRTHYRGLATRAGRGLRSHDQASWIRLVDVDRANLLAAFEDSSTSGDVETALVIASALAPYMQVRGQLTDGRNLVAGALDIGAGPNELRATTLVDLAHLSFFQCDYSEMGKYADAALDLIEPEEHPVVAADALAVQGLAALKQRDPALAHRLLDESQRLYEDAGDSWGAGTALSYQGLVSLDEGDMAAARQSYEASLTRLRGDGESWVTAFSLCALGNLARSVGDRNLADSLLTEALSMSQRMDDAWGVARAEAYLGRLRIDDGEFEIAATLLTDSLDRFLRMGDREDTALCLEGIAALVAAQGDAESAVELFGAGQRVRASVMPAFSSENLDYLGTESVVDGLRHSLGVERFTEAMERGKALRSREAITSARRQAARLVPA
jgi:predicted ATPase/DNA-binding SARP family transcriptional activator